MLPNGTHVPRIGKFPTAPVPSSSQSNFHLYMYTLPAFRMDGCACRSSPYQQSTVQIKQLCVRLRPNALRSCVHPNFRSCAEFLFIFGKKPHNRQQVSSSFTTAPTQRQGANQPNTARKRVMRPRTGRSDGQRNGKPQYHQYGHRPVLYLWVSTSTRQVFFRTRCSIHPDCTFFETHLPHLFGIRRERMERHNAVGRAIQKNNPNTTHKRVSLWRRGMCIAVRDGRGGTREPPRSRSDKHVQPANRS